MKLSRRQVIIAAGASAIPAKGLAWSDQQRVLIDRTLPDIARYLPKSAITIDRTGDAVRQLHSLLASSEAPVAGLTTCADMQIARGSAREQRRKFTLLARHGTVFHWTITGAHQPPLTDGPSALS